MKVLENEDPGPWNSLDLEKESSASTSRQQVSKVACPQGRGFRRAEQWPPAITEAAAAPSETSPEPPPAPEGKADVSEHQGCPHPAAPLPSQARPPSQASLCDALTLKQKQQISSSHQTSFFFFSLLFFFLKQIQFFNHRPTSEAKQAAPAALSAPRAAASPAPAKAEPSCPCTPSSGRERASDMGNPLHRFAVALCKRQHPWKGADQSNYNQHYRGRRSCPWHGLSIRTCASDVMQSQDSSTSLPHQAWGLFPPPAGE